ncbi:alpha/beta hydrolase [Flexivirga caeni]|uniref:Alpha/beta hydrolase n=1 Tax=Flexivirga caeni TaxID=2294115 RepID=A0A3M9MI74_9MICO|nr:alpha/beta hydrolase [Flexivirga caeni]RNI25226.1 alpha/beta hydrolase [Flexivirga caeni]
MLVDRYPAYVGGPELHMLLYEPVRCIEPGSGVLLLHGGALSAGTPQDMAPHCEALAERGIFAASAAYRLLGQGAQSIDDCLSDVNAAIARFMAMAAAHGLPTDRLAIGGSSAGAHLALVSAMPQQGRGELSARHRMNAVIALNPAGLDLAAHDQATQRSLEARIGTGPGSLLRYSLMERVRSGGPAVLIQHGTADEVEPIAWVRRFRDAMIAVGNRCELLEYESARHAFHYPGTSNGDNFTAVIDATARFLADLR